MNSYPDPVGLIGLIVVFGVLPFVALMTTSYTKLVIVFGLLRAALGLQQTPPNMVINGIAIILTVYIMAPIGMDIADGMKHQHISSRPGVGEVMSIANLANKPIKEFLSKHTMERERQFFLKSATAIWPKHRADALQSDDLIVLIPSFALSELTRAFQIGFVLYLMFVVVDLIVATVLLALGMSMIAPTTISLPFKLLLFVSLDGWSRLVHGLVLSYR